jgi:hypothetical protein
VIVLPVDAAPVIVTPVAVEPLNATTLRGPIVFCDEAPSRRMPVLIAPRSTVPPVSVPIQLPAIPLCW